MAEGGEGAKWAGVKRHWHRREGTHPRFSLSYSRQFQVVNPSTLGGGGSCSPLPAFSFRALYFTGLFSCLVIGISRTWVIRSIS